MALMLADEAGHVGIVKLVTKRKQFLGFHVISFIHFSVNRRVLAIIYRRLPVESERNRKRLGRLGLPG